MIESIATNPKQELNDCNVFFSNISFEKQDIDGNIKETWEGVRVRGLQTLPDGIVLAADNLKRIRNYNFKDISDSNL